MCVFIEFYGIDNKYAILYSNEMPSIYWKESKKTNNIILAC